MAEKQVWYHQSPALEKEIKISSVGLHIFTHSHLVSFCVCVRVHRYAASIDDILEEEEHYADQVKEYLFYTDAVR